MGIVDDFSISHLSNSNAPQIVGVFHLPTDSTSTTKEKDCILSKTNGSFVPVVSIVMELNHLDLFRRVAPVFLTLSI